MFRAAQIFATREHKNNEQQHERRGVSSGPSSGAIRWCARSPGFTLEVSSHLHRRDGRARSNPTDVVGALAAGTASWFGV